MISISLDKSQLAKEVYKHVWQTQNQFIKKAMVAAATVVEDEYRDVLRTMPPMQGRLGNDSFQIAWMTVAKKVRMFRDGNGAWAVIGHQTAGSGQSLSPQAWFAEHGTVQRKTKAGQNRGIMPAQHYLQIAANRSMPLAVEAFWNKLRELVNAGS